MGALARMCCKVLYMLRIVFDCIIREACSSLNGLVTFFGNKELEIQFYFYIRNIIAIAMVALKLKIGEGTI